MLAAKPGAYPRVEHQKGASLGQALTLHTLDNAGQGQTL
jgi:hypothetical protein